MQTPYHKLAHKVMSFFVAILMCMGIPPMFINGSETMAIEFDFDTNAVLKDTPTKIVGVNHVGLSVQNLERALKFYQSATEFELVHTESFENDISADILFGRSNIKVKTAVLRAPNWILELSQFEHNESAKLVDMPVIGPGMSHTCYQSPEHDPGYKKFVAQGARILNRGDKPVCSSLYGVSYVYAYDLEGNLLELEQLEGKTLKDAGYSGKWQEGQTNMWMSQVSLFTHDRDRLMGFYQDVFEIKPNRVAEVGAGEFGDNLFDIDGPM